MENLPPDSYIFLSYLTDHKDVRVLYLYICYAITSHYFTPLAARCSPKRFKSFQLHFPKDTLIAAHSYILMGGQISILTRVDRLDCYYSIFLSCYCVFSWKRF